MVENSCLQPPPDGPATDSNTYMSSRKNRSITSLQTLVNVWHWHCCCRDDCLFISYSLTAMLDRHVVVQTVCSVPDDVNRKALQSSALQNGRTMNKTVIAHSIHMQLLNLLFFLPVADDDDVDLQSCVFQPLLYTTTHLLTGSSIKLLYWKS